MSQNFYQSILKQSPYGYICHRINGDLQLQIDINQIEDTNDSFLELFGLYQGEDVLKRVGELLTKPKEENGFNWGAYFSHVLDNNNPSSTEFFYLPQNKWIHLNSFITEGLLVTFATAICVKKIKGKQQCAVLHDELNKLSLITEQSPVSVVITDTKGNIEYVNPKFCQLTGYSPEEVMGGSPRILKSGLTSQEHHQHLWKTISNGQEWRGEFINRKKNGDIYYESAVIAPALDEFGKIINYVGVKEDITERILAERVLVANNKRLASLVEVAQAFGSTIKMDKLLKIVITNGMSLLEMDSGVIYFVTEDKLERACSLPEINMEDHNKQKSFGFDDFPHIHQCIQQKEVLIINDLDHLTLTPKEKWITQLNKAKSVLAIPLLLEDKVLAVMVLRSCMKNRILNQTDLEVCQVLALQASLALKNTSLYKEVNIHAEKLATYNSKLCVLNEELLISKDRAEESDRLKTGFLQNISHEIRTPMNGILGFVELLKMKDLSEETRQNYLGYVTNSTNQLLNVLDDIMNISRLEAQSVILKKERVNPVAIIEDVYNKYLTRTPTDVVLIKENPVMEQDRILVTESAWLFQVVEKLVDNAVKFTKTGSVRFGYSLAEYGRVHFFVEDTGIGIDGDKVPLIFKSFYQVDMGANREFGGNGLGLTIASKVVESMGSTLNVETMPEKGSYFHFDLELTKESRFI